MEPKQILQQEREYDLKELKTVLLVGTYSSSHAKPLAQESLQELRRLCETFGIEVVEEVLSPLKKIDAGLYLGQGKLEEIQQRGEEAKAAIILFDDELSPKQQRNLQAFFKKVVIDRTEIIIEVFAQRAQTKEAKLQIELAKIQYQFPRLRGMWTHLSRQSSGGGGHVKGEGEKQIEIDKRLLKKRLDHMRQEIEAVRLQRETQRLLRKRSGIPTFAIVGYTNAGKSTLLNALTGSHVHAEDKLFATLDTTTRKLELPNNQEVLVVDTVGFIRKIPHTLIEAFKSTLEEAVHTDVLLHLVDSSHPWAEEQRTATLALLKELGAENRPVITVFNKVDACQDQAYLLRMKLEYPKAIFLSATQPQTLPPLLERMEEVLASLRKEVRVRLPQSEYALVSELMREGHVIQTDYEENDVILRIEIPSYLEYKVQPFLT